MRRPIRIGVLISGGGSNLQSILDACQAGGTIHGQVVVVGSDVPDAGGLGRARQCNIPTFHVDYSRGSKGTSQIESLNALVPKDFELARVLSLTGSGMPVSDKLVAYYMKRAVAEAAILKQLANYEVDLLVLAGFMRLLSPYIIDKFNIEPLRPRIMNIHPSLLPAFPGTDGYGDTYRYGCRVAGCTVHFVDYGEDTGPVIGQKAFEIRPEDTIDSIREKGLRLEWALYTECIELFAQDRLRVVCRECGSGGQPIGRKVVEISPGKKNSQEELAKLT